MPKLELTPAEACFLSMIEEETGLLEKRAQELLLEAREKRRMAVDLVFDSHKEPRTEADMKVKKDQNGRPVSLEWEKK